MLSEKLMALARQLWDTSYLKAVKPCHLPETADLDAEHIKINVMRVALGLLALSRTGLITYSAYNFYPADGFLSCPPEFWISLVALVLVGCFTFGLFTPVVTIGLLLLYNPMDIALKTTTLGTNLFTLCLFYFLFTNAGSRLSIDAVNLRNPKSFLHLPTRLAYRLISFPSSEQIRAYSWLLLVAYGALSLAAISLHLQDEYWRSGKTVALMMNNSFLCSQWQICRSMSQQFPWLVSVFSAISGAGQTFFQVFMIPLVYTRMGTWFVGLWGAAFALISLVLMQISWIPSTECVLWALIFCPARVITSVARWIKPDLDSLARVIGQQSSAVSLSVTAVSMVALLLLALVTLGHHYPSVGLFRKATKYVGPQLYYLGLDVPDVFNRLDLSTDKYWYVASRRDAEGTTTHVPIAFKNGSRDFYHWFDTIYFGNFLPWRRMMGLYDGDPREQLAPEGPCRKLIAQAVRFDQKMNRLPKDVEYLVTVYAADPDGRIDNPSVVVELSFGGTTGVADNGSTID